VCSLVVACNISVRWIETTESEALGSHDDDYGSGSSNPAFGSKSRNVFDGNEERLLNGDPHG
jgi:hypothetical protein